MQVLIALLAFGTFLGALVVGVRALLDQETNRADTILSLSLGRLTTDAEKFAAALARMTHMATLDFAQAMRNFAEALRRAY